MSVAARVESPQPTVLVVEDEVLIRIHIGQYLRDCGYKVLEAAHAGEALEVLSSDAAVHIVFSDIEMPGTMDGFGLSKWIREHRKDLKVVLVGSPEKAANKAAELCEDGPHLTKPYEPQALHDLLKRKLGFSGKN